MDDRQHKEVFKRKMYAEKCFSENGQRKTDDDKVLEKSGKCTKEIFKTRKNYTLKMIQKLMSCWKNVLGYSNCSYY